MTTQPSDGYDAERITSLEAENHTLKTALDSREKYAKKLATEKQAWSETRETMRHEIKALQGEITQKNSIIDEINVELNKLKKDSAAVRSVCIHACCCMMDLDSFGQVKQG